MPGEIEFLAQDDDCRGDEERPRGPAPRRRVAFVVQVGVGCVVAVTLAVWVATHADRGGTDGASVPRSSSIPPPPTASGAPPIYAYQPCRSGQPADPAIVAAMRRDLPGIRVSSRAERTCTAILRGGDEHTVAERVVGRYRGLDLIIDISARGSYTPRYPVRGPHHHRLLGAVDTESADIDVHISIFGGPQAGAHLDDVQPAADDLSHNVVL